MGNDEVRSVSSTGGKKGTKTCRPDLIPAQAWMELATHYGVGAEKYTERDEFGNVTHDGAHNWRLGYEWSKSVAALLRHVLAFMAGEDYDEETGSKHIIAAAWHCMTLATFMDDYRQFDDRPLRWERNMTTSGVSNTSGASPFMSDAQGGHRRGRQKWHRAGVPRKTRKWLPHFRSKASGTDAASPPGTRGSTTRA